MKIIHFLKKLLFEHQKFFLLKTVPIQTYHKTIEKQVNGILIFFYFKSKERIAGSWVNNFKNARCAPECSKREMLKIFV